MIMKKSQAMSKSPLELELERLNVNRISQQKNVELDYIVLKMLNKIVTDQKDLVCTPTFMDVYCGLLQMDETNHLKSLPLFENMCYLIWNDENFPIEIREKTAFYKIVSNWIISFELRVGKLQTIQSQFELIKIFMLKQAKTPLQRIVMIEQTYEDLKELIDEQFWKQPNLKTGTVTTNSTNLEVAKKTTNNEEQINENMDDIQQIIGLLEIVVVTGIFRLGQKQNLYKACTYPEYQMPNFKKFIKRCLNFILYTPHLPAHLQMEITKLCISYLQTLSLSEAEESIQLLKLLMVKIDKSVRYALIMEFVEFYEYLEKTNNQVVIEEVENIVYFRELIIGKSLIEEALQNKGGNSSVATPLTSIHEIIKSGSTKKVYFSNEYDKQTVLKLEVLLDQHDITIKICSLTSISAQCKHESISEIITALNTIDPGSIANYKEQPYWKEEKSVSKNLQIRLENKGLYSIEFDNSYSWIHSKSIRFKIELYQPL